MKTNEKMQKWYCLDNDGKIRYVGKFSSFGNADAAIGSAAIWLATEDVARQWLVDLKSILETTFQQQQQEQKEATMMASQDIKTPNPTEPPMPKTTNTSRTKPPIQAYPGQQFGMPQWRVEPFTPPPFRYQSTSTSVQLQVASSSIRSSLSSAHELLSGCSMVYNSLTQSMFSSPGMEQKIDVLKEIEAEMAEVSEVLLQKLRFLETKAQKFDNY